MCITPAVRVSCAVLCVVAWMSVEAYDLAGAADKAPCSFFDSVNISGSMRFENGTYLHDGVLIPSQLVASFDYVYLFREQKTPVEPHMRGCICLLKPCLNFCCQWGYKYNYTTEDCRQAPADIDWPQQQIELTFANGSQKTVTIHAQFALQYQRPCKTMLAWVKEADKEERWNLFENGEITNLHSKRTVTKKEYCLSPVQNNAQQKAYVIATAVCPIITEFGIVKQITAYGMFISVFFMVLTILAYLAVPELLSLHGKSLVCYLFGLIVGYSILTCHALLHLNLDRLYCALMGYTAYFFFMSSFFWLNVISFYLWYSFNKVGGATGQSPKVRFIAYALFAYGLAAVFTFLTALAQEFSDLPNALKPGIGGGRFCWLDQREWSTMIYFFGPILCTTAINTVFFVRTFMRIRREQREIELALANKDSTKSFHPESDRFVLFLRLFIIMGVIWSVEIISYLTGWERKWTKIFYLTDFINAMQGVVIFMLFVLKKSVRILLKKRFFYWRAQSEPMSTRDTKRSTASLYSNTTQSTTVSCDETVDRSL